VEQDQAGLAQPVPRTQPELLVAAGLAFDTISTPTASASFYTPVTLYDLWNCSKAAAKQN